jgi:hypothetical protein
LQADTFTLPPSLPPSLSLGRFQIQTRVSIIDSLSPPFVIGLDVLRHCRCEISFQDEVRREEGREGGKGAAPVISIVLASFIHFHGSPFPLSLPPSLLQVLILRSPGGAVEKSREEIVPFSIGAAPTQPTKKEGGREGGREEEEEQW